MESRDTRQAAEALKKSLETIRIANGRTIGDAVVEYKAFLERKGNKPGSVKTAMHRLNSILDQTRALIDLTPRRAQDWYDDLVDEGGAVDTHHGALVQAKAFGGWCVKKGLTRANPFAGIEAVGKKSRGKEQLRVDESRKFGEACIGAWVTHADRGAIAAALPLYFNLRASEVANLTARDIDDDGRLLWIADAKTPAGRRQLDIPPFMRAALLELAEKPATAGGALFAKRRGEQADRYWVRRQTSRLMKAAGVKHVTTHGLRGTHATMGTVAGSTPDAVARSMGHTDPGMTKRHYIDAEQAASAQVGRVANALAPRVTHDENSVTHKSGVDSDE